MVAAITQFLKHETPARTRATARDVAILAVIGGIGFSVAAISWPPEGLSRGLWFGVGANVFIVAIVVACSNAWAYATSRVDVVRITDHGVHWNGADFTWDSVTQVEFSELPGADNVFVSFLIS